MLTTKHARRNRLHNSVKLGVVLGITYLALSSSAGAAITTLPFLYSPDEVIQDTEIMQDDEADSQASGGLAIQIVADNKSPIKDIAERYGVDPATINTVSTDKHARVLEVQLPEAEIQRPSIRPDSIITYVVKKGDTLTVIADHFKIPMVDLLSANLDRKNLDEVELGEIINVPTTVRGLLLLIKPGQTSLSLITAYGADLTETAKVNDVLPTELHAGDHLLLPGLKAEKYAQVLIAKRDAAIKAKQADVAKQREIEYQAYLNRKKRERLEAHYQIQEQYERYLSWSKGPERQRQIQANERQRQYEAAQAAAAAALAARQAEQVRQAAEIQANAREEANRLAANRAEANRAEVRRLEANRLAANRAEANRAEVRRLEANRLAANRAEANRAEANRAEVRRLEANRQAANRAEANRAEANRAEVRRLEANRQAANRAEANRAEANRAEVRRLEANRLARNRQRAIARQTAARPVIRAAAGFRGSGLRWPMRTFRLTSRFGEQDIAFHRLNFHGGIDLAASYGTPIYAATEGVVAQSGWGDYGKNVITHNGNSNLVYGHMSRTAVVNGQSVYAGQLLGYVGCTGMCTGPHLHFEIRINGRPVNPLAYLP